MPVQCRSRRRWAKFLRSKVGVAPRSRIDYACRPMSVAAPTNDPAVAHQKLVAELASVVGEKVAGELDVAAEVHFIMLQAEPDLAIARAQFDGALATMLEHTNDDFCRRYRASLRRKLLLLRDAQIAAAALPAFVDGDTETLLGEVMFAEAPTEPSEQPHARTGLDSLRDEDLARVLTQRIGRF